MAHAAVGGIMGVLISDDAKRGAISGAIGAVAAEVMAEMFQGDQGAWLTAVDQEATAQGYARGSVEYNGFMDQKIRTLADLSKLSTALVTLLAGQDVKISLQTATNAVENNFIQFLIPAATAYIATLATAEGLGLTLATIATAAYLISQTQGDKAAVQDLVNQGQVGQTPMGYRYAGKLYANATLVWLAFQAANASVFDTIKADTKTQPGYQAAPQGTEWTDKGLSQEESKSLILSTPIHDDPSWQEGYEAPPADLNRPHEPGFQVYDGPDSTVLSHKEDELVYKEVPYHHSNSKGNKSKCPSNPQTASDNSIIFNPSNTRRRVAVDTKSKEFLVFSSSNDGTWHDHLRKWDDLRPEMQNALIKTGKVTRSGKIK